MKTATNITPLRKAVRTASNIYGSVRLADGTHMRMRLIKGDVIEALRKTQSSHWPETFAFRVDSAGDVYLGEEPKPESLIQDLASEVIGPQLEAHGISVADLDEEEAVRVFRAAVLKAKAAANT